MKMISKIFLAFILYYIQTSNASVGKGNVYVYLYNQANINVHYAALNLEDFGAIASQLDLSKPLFIWTHGWDDITDVDSDNTIGQAILNRYDINQIYVDYPYKTLYTDAKDNTVDIGRYVGEFIQFLYTTYNYSYSKVRLGGHSLGAHISGIAGKTVNGTIDSIIGLDPAGPGYVEPVTSNRLTSSDAQYVEAIHTNTLTAGIAFNVGDSDFYPNGGSFQPNCLLSLDIACSHKMAITYYVNSISNVLTAKQCGSQLSILLTSCYGSSGTMGGYNLDRSANGMYYLSIS